MSKLKVTQVRSAITRNAKQRGTIRALGIKRVGHSVVHDDKPEIRGMLRVVEHLVEVQEIVPTAERESQFDTRRSRGGAVTTPGGRESQFDTRRSRAEVEA